MSKVAVIIGGLAYGLIVAFLALNIAGGGGGWNSAMISSVAIILVPLGAIAWFQRRRSLASIVLSVAAIADAVLVIATWREGFHYALRVGSVAPRLVLVWLLLWAGWQLGLLAILVSRGFETRPNT
jgi:hypothetical protein